MKAQRISILVGLVAILVLGLLFFRELLVPGQLLFATDDNIGNLSALKAQLPGAMRGGWWDGALLGMRETIPIKPRTLLLWLLPAQLFFNVANAFFLGVGSLFLFLFLRDKRLKVQSSLLGILTAFWLASNFTLLYAGHQAKSAVLMFACICLYCLNRAIVGRQISWSVLAGAALGYMFVEQQDVALFVALVVGPYILFVLWPGLRQNWRLFARLFIPLISMAALLAVPATWHAYQVSVRGVAAMEQEDAAEKWDYCTQWSWPPEETIDFIAPGYMGWRSGEPAGPYWGRMGRSSGWETTHQGFQNFKLENQYLGAIPLAMAVFALLAAMLYKRKSHPALEGLDNDTRHEIIFWGCATLITLLLAFGKYFPLYALFYHLPMISAIRNPNKFLQIFQLALAILSAYGLDMVMRSTPAAGCLHAPTRGKRQSKQQEKQT